MVLEGWGIGEIHLLLGFSVFFNSSTHTHNLHRYSIYTKKNSSFDEVFSSLLLKGASISGSGSVVLVPYLAMVCPRDVLQTEAFGPYSYSIFSLGGLLTV